MSDETTTTPATKANGSWHDTKWKLLVVSVAVGFIIGAGSMSGDRAAAESDSKRIVAEAKSERAKILGSAGEEKDSLASDVSNLRGEKKALTADVKKLRGEFAALTKRKAASTFEGNGMYLVGTDVAPGTYRAAASPGCYYAVLANLSGAGNDIITNGNVDGPVVFTVPSSAKGVEVSRCATFTRVPG